jgi:hypothetical protein
LLGAEHPSGLSAPVGSNHPATTYTIVSGREISQAAGSLRGIAASIFHNIRSVKSSSGTVLLFAMFE